jgi:hypothetical protein
VLAVFLNAGGGAARLEALRSEIFEEIRKVKKLPCMGTCQSYTHQWMNEGNISQNCILETNFPNGESMEMTSSIWSSTKLHSPKQLERRFGHSSSIATQILRSKTLLPSFVEQRRDLD